MILPYYARRVHDNCGIIIIVLFFYRLGESSKYGSVNEEVFMSTTPTMTGAFVRQPSNSSGKVYCIHGKPSGCCATLVSADDNNSNHETPDPVDGKSSITICKYRSKVYLTYYTYL